MGYEPSDFINCIMNKIKTNIVQQNRMNIVNLIMSKFWDDIELDQIIEQVSGHILETNVESILEYYYKESIIHVDHLY